MAEPTSKGLRVAPTDIDCDPFAARLRQLDRSLGPAGQRVADYIGHNRAASLACSARDLAERARTSDATVVRTVQLLGFSGIADLKQCLVTSLGNPATPADDMRRTLAETGAEIGDAIQLVLDTHAGALEALRTPQSRADLAEAVGVLDGAARIVVFGIGPSAALAEYASLQLQRCGRSSCSLTGTGIRLADQLLGLRAGDVILAMAYGRAYREVVTVLAEAARLRLKVVLITDDRGSLIAARSEIVAVVPRGRAGRVAMHGVTLMALEALVLGLAAARPATAISALERLNALRQAASGQRHDLG